MSMIRRHPSWHTWGHVQKAQWLVDTYQAKSFSHACSILGSLNKQPAPITVRPKINQQLQLDGLQFG